MGDAAAIFDRLREVNSLRDDVGMLFTSREYIFSGSFPYFSCDSVMDHPDLLRSRRPRRHHTAVY